MSWFRTPGVAGKPDYTGLQLQTSISTLPVPIVYGQTKLAANVVWYANFQTHGSAKSGKGGLFSSPNAQTTTYSADVILALCEGPIGGVRTVYKDQSLFTAAQLGLTLFTGTTPQATWGYLNSAYPAQALAYQGTAYFAAASYALGSAASIGNHNFEVVGILAGTGVNGIDADPAQVIYDFLTNPQYGCNFNPASIDTTTLYGAGGDASLQSYCRALGIAFSPAIVSAEQGSAILARWLGLLNCAAVWSGGKLKFIPYGDTAVAAGNVVSSVAPMTVPSPPSGWATVIVSGSAQFVSDGGVTYAFTAKPLTHTGTAPTGAGTYGINPPGTYLFNIGDEGKAIDIAYSYSTPVGYVPNLTPLYNLQDTDFVDGKSGDPLTVVRVDPFTLPNITRLSCLSRSNGYADVPVEARDQSQIETFGPVVDSSRQGREITDDINVGRIVAQTINQRKLYVRATYRFTLSWEYVLLEPMDLVTITDAAIGVVNQAVRVISVEEDATGMLAVEAEDLDVLVSTPVLYPSATVDGGSLNRGAQAAKVNTPLIFEPPPALTNNVAQLWFGASGGVAGVPDPNWGGAFVWLSVDNTTYSQIGAIQQPARQGVLTGALAAASGWQPTESVGVDLSESGGALSGTTATSAQAGATLALIGQELIAYEAATLVSANAYTLSGLQRGLYATAPATHASGDAFMRLDGAILSYSLPASYIGKTLYFKFQSFNVFGGGVEPLSDCVAYSHAVLGAGVAMPGNVAGFGGALTLDGAAYTLAAQWTAEPNSTAYTVQWSVDNATWNTIYSGSDHSFSSKGWGYIATLYLRIVGVNGPYVSPAWQEITLLQGAQVTVPVENAGLYVQFASLSPSFQAQINSISAAADDTLTSARADVVAAVDLAAADAAEATAFLVSTHAASQTAAVAKTAALAAANATAGLSVSLSQTSSLLNAGIAQNYALIVSNQIAQATVNTSLAGDITTLTSTVDDDVLSLQGQITTLSATAGTANSVVSTKADTIAAAIALDGDGKEVTDFLDAVAAGKALTTALSATNLVGAAVTNANTAVANLTLALATSTQQLAAGVAGANALISSESVTRASADSALSATITSLSATVSGNLTTTNASISSEATTRANADTALSSSLSSLSSTVSSNNSAQTASISSEATTRANADNALSVSISTLSSTVNSNNSAVNASISSEATTRANADNALSALITSVTATANQATASGQIEFAATAGSAGASAAYSLRVMAAGGGGFSEVGFRAEALSAGGSQFVISAPQFIVENGSTQTVVFATNPDGTLTLQGVTKVATAIESLATTTGGNPNLVVDFANGALLFYA